MGVNNNLCFLILIVLSFSITTQSVVSDCVYTVFVKTGSMIWAGTDSTISLKLYDKYGQGLAIANLETWGGLMGPGHDYFERGNLDIFRGRGPCLSSRVCAMNLTSDGSGLHAGWYCNYLEVTSTGPNMACAQQVFTVEQWLNVDKLSATDNSCTSVEGGQDRDLIMKSSSLSSTM